MIKKRKKRAIYSIGRTTFDTFKAMKTLRKAIKIREYLENQKKQYTFAVFKK